MDKVWRTSFLTTVKWLIGNLLFGLAPLLFMLFIYCVAQGEVGEEQMIAQIHDGVVLFVFCAIMGSILLDYWLGGHPLIGSQIFTIFGFPFGLLFILCINYLCIVLKIIPETRFDLTSLTSIVFILMSILYCLYSKTALYVREASNKDNAPS